MVKIFFTISSLIIASLTAHAWADNPELPQCPNSAILTGGYAPSPWPTCAALFSSVLIRCLNEGNSEMQCRDEMQAAADAKDAHSQCLWHVLCENKNTGSNKAVTRKERMDAEAACTL